MTWVSAAIHYYCGDWRMLVAMTGFGITCIPLMIFSHLGWLRRRERLEEKAFYDDVRSGKAIKGRFK